MGLSIKVKDVKPLDNLWLKVDFENGIQKYYNITQLIPQFPMYKDLYNEDLFKLVRVDCGGYAIAWNSDIDISECELWENGISIERYKNEKELITQ